MKTTQETPIDTDDDENLQKKYHRSLQMIFKLLKDLEDFGNYLQGWADMLEEERKGFNNEEFEGDIFLDLQNITHPRY